MGVWSLAYLAYGVGVGWIVLGLGLGLGLGRGLGLGLGLGPCLGQIVGLRSQRRQTAGRPISAAFRFRAREISGCRLGGLTRTKSCRRGRYLGLGWAGVLNPTGS